MEMTERQTASTLRAGDQSSVSMDKQMWPWATPGMQQTIARPPFHDFREMTVYGADSCEDSEVRWPESAGPSPRMFAQASRPPAEPPRFPQNRHPAGERQTDKVFVGGLQAECTEDDLVAYFGQYGHIIDAVVMVDKMTGRPRGFGFVQWDNVESVDLVMKDRETHSIGGKWVDVKRSVPKGEGESGGVFAPSGPGGGGYQAMRSAPSRSFRVVPDAPYGRTLPGKPSWGYLNDRQSRSW